MHAPAVAIRCLFWVTYLFKPSINYRQRLNIIDSDLELTVYPCQVCFIGNWRQMNQDVVIGVPNTFNLWLLTQKLTPKHTMIKSLTTDYTGQVPSRYQLWVHLKLKTFVVVFCFLLYRLLVKIISCTVKITWNIVHRYICTKSQRVTFNTNCESIQNSKPPWYNLCFWS